MALIFVLGICMFTAYVVRGASRQAESAWREPEPTSPMTELPPLPVPPVIPDTVPTDWIEAHGSDDGQ